ncbi:MAG: phenylalanine--tRNA ligase subunit alpha [Candidatus Omnitrophota bacterium]|nr:phenylalanine--tRNA ligase subunit alpha [Candidatus Omnitrophota bacterium]
MLWDIEALKKKAQEEINSAQDLAGVDAMRIKYLGRKGIIAEIFSKLPELSAEEKSQTGKFANELKFFLTELINNKVQQLKTIDHRPKTVDLDITLPGIKPEIGTRHPITQVLEEICAIFTQMGFKIFDSPEIETEFNNFTALNIPLEHPSRDAFDTFYIRRQKLLLRSHTSPGQIRVMKKYKPPLAVVVPGKVYRPDAVDASHSFMFHQVEGFLVDERVRFSDLKGVLTNFSQELFGSDIKMRFRPHFFPFTEPSAEVDISCVMCEGKGCSVCGKKGWLEILGAGMIHPNVFKAVGYPKNKYTGFAFGMGVERIAMLKYGIDDIRLFFENDLRFLRQF